MPVSVNMDELTTLTFTATAFGFSDLGDSPADLFVAVKITTLPAAGSLKLNGAPLGAAQRYALT